MHADQPIRWTRWATPGKGPEFRYTARRPVRLTDLVRRLRDRLSYEHEKGGRSC